MPTVTMTTTETEIETARDVSFDEVVAERSGISAGAWEERSSLAQLQTRQSKWAALFDSRQPQTQQPQTLAQAA